MAGWRVVSHNQLVIFLLIFWYEVPHDEINT